VLADHALVDQQGKLSIIGIWRNVVVPQLPGLHPRAHLVLLMAGRRDEVGEHRVSLALVDPDGVTRLEHHGAVQMHEPPPGEGEVESPGVIVLDLPVHAAGGHAVVVTIDGTEAARVPFTVAVPPRQQPQVH
jgi:hypothetical protein